MNAARPVPAAFVRAHTRPVRPPLVPEVTLLVAADVVLLWEAMEERQGNAPSEPPFWAAAWPGGQALARHVLDHSEVVAGRSVLDLGSGSGLVAVAAAVGGGGAARGARGGAGARVGPPPPGGGGGGGGGGGETPPGGGGGGWGKPR